MSYNVDHSENLDYKLKEINFFATQFRKKKQDDLAYSIVKDINSYLQAGGNHLEIIGYMYELENYSSQSLNSDFLWNLVYIRRHIANWYSKMSDDYEAAEFTFAAAEIFARICEVAPTPYNRCCRILENLQAVLYYKNSKAKKPSQIETLLEFCKMLYAGVSESDQGIETLYFKTGYFLYMEMYTYSIDYIRDTKEQYSRLTKLIYLTQRYYEKDKSDYDLLRGLVKQHLVSTTFSEFSYDDRKESLDIMEEFVREAKKNGGTSFLEVYDKLQLKLGVIRAKK